MAEETVHNVMFRMPDSVYVPMLGHIAEFNAQRQVGSPELTQQSFLLTLVALTLQGMANGKRKRAPKVLDANVASEKADKPRKPSKRKARK